ncbi:MAG: hypothetical protein OJF52_002205 [Nitrospira sp.]|jgi:hypothetical protein|nr:MAG: hypothetical protein OJF52_002205 [Nitrospira sp.]
MVRHQHMAVWDVLIFWGVVFLLIQQAERLFLTAEVMAADPPTAGLLVNTFAAGLGNDLSVAVGGLGIAAFLAGLLTGLLLPTRSDRTSNGLLNLYSRCLAVWSFLIAVCLLAVSTADISYYSYNHRHLDFVFFEYIDELLHTTSPGTTSQAAEQTGAELEDPMKWILRIGGFWGLTAFFVWIWNTNFTRLEHRHVAAWGRSYPATLLTLLSIMAGGAAVGITPPLTSENETYYGLSQNPIVFAQHALRDAFLSQWSWIPVELPEPMNEEEAVATARLTIGEGRDFPFSDYPFISRGNGTGASYFDRPVNIVLIFVEGLDRRYLGRSHPIASPSLTAGPQSSTTHAVHLTPFLDRLKEESLYFSHFFSNGVQTTRGLFSTFCSTIPRQGTAVIKTRNTHNYLCLPSLLGKAGYETEMVVSLDQDLPGLKPFLQRNGIERYFGERDVPAQAERLGVGLTDGALLEMLEARLEVLQKSHGPFFLSVLTSGMHHPFAVPSDHSEVRMLQSEPDGYLAALRYFDLQLEQSFARLRTRDLLNNTIVLILGDHGRHETEGRTDLERQVGHFMSPLFIWLDDSLRQSRTFRPRSVEQVASQVDVAPTILAVNGLTPPLSPFVGRDLSCLFSGPCLDDNRAYLSSVYDDLIGLADHNGIWLYSFRRGLLTSADLDLREGAGRPAGLDPHAPPPVRAMAGLYLASNFAIEHNRVWFPHGVAEQLRNLPPPQDPGIAAHPGSQH